MIEAFSSISRLVDVDTAMAIVKLALVACFALLLAIGLYFIAFVVSSLLDSLCKSNVLPDPSRCICHKAKTACDCRPLEMGAHDDR